MKKNIFIVFIVLLVLSFIVFFPKEKDLKLFGFELDTLEISIDGEVNSPGTYKVESGKTLGYLIHMAGGLTNYANISNLDLKQIVQNKNYHIEGYEKKQDSSVIKKNLNELSYNDLILIPYVTNDIALDILIYKKNNGLFTHISELLNIKGIGEKKLEKIKEYIYIW